MFPIFPSCRKCQKPTSAKNEPACTECYDGSYLDPKTKECKFCALDYCQKCQLGSDGETAECLECYQNAILRDGKCETCADQTCQICEENVQGTAQQCLQCQYGYYITNDNKCDSCANVLGNCTYCEIHNSVA